MALFVGRYVNRIDRKGRVSVPKLFRDALGSQSFSGLYVYPLFKFKAFEACDEDFMGRLSDSLEDLPMFSDERTTCPSSSRARIVFPSTPKAAWRCPKTSSKRQVFLVRPFSSGGDVASRFGSPRPTRPTAAKPSNGPAPATPPCNCEGRKTRTRGRTRPWQAAPPTLR